jgi:hypothetical protein
MVFGLRPTRTIFGVCDDTAGAAGVASYQVNAPLTSAFCEALS